MKYNLNADTYHIPHLKSSWDSLRCCPISLHEQSSKVKKKAQTEVHTEGTSALTSTNMRTSTSTSANTDTRAYTVKNTGANTSASANKAKKTTKNKKKIPKNNQHQQKQSRKLTHNVHATKANKYRPQSREKPHHNTPKHPKTTRFTLFS